MGMSSSGLEYAKRCHHVNFGAGIERENVVLGLRTVRTWGTLGFIFYVFSVFVWADNGL